MSTLTRPVEGYRCLDGCGLWAPAERWEWDGAGEVAICPTGGCESYPLTELPRLAETRNLAAPQGRRATT